MNMHTTPAVPPLGRAAVRRSALRSALRLVPAFLTILSLGTGFTALRADSAFTPEEIKILDDVMIKLVNQKLENKEAEDFLVQQGYPVDGAYAKEILNRTATARAIIVNGVKPDSPAFKQLYAARTGSSGATVDAAAAKAAKEKETVNRAVVDRFEYPSERYTAAEKKAKLRREKLQQRENGETVPPSDIPTLESIPYTTDVGLRAIAGVRLISPYKFVAGNDQVLDGDGNVTTPATASRLESAGTDALPYFELAFTNRWAWRDERIRTSYLDRSERKELRKGEFLPFLSPKKGNFADGEVRLGYTVGSDDDTAAQIVGSGRFHAEATLAPHLYHAQFPGGAQTYTLELSGGIVTDGNSFSADHHWFAGFGYTSQLFGQSGPNDSRRRPALLAVRAGWAGIKVPDADPETWEVRRVVRNGTTHVAPRYVTDKGFSFQAEILYPVNEASYLVFGGQVYSVDPDTWTLSLGLTTDLSDILKKLAP